MSFFLCTFAQLFAQEKKKNRKYYSKDMRNLVIRALAAKKNLFILCITALMTGVVNVKAEMAPIYYEGFSRCFDEEDENYGYTGGNDNQWGGDIAKAIVIYQDAPEWTFTYCNAGFQCLKVGTSTKQGAAQTPFIACEGEAVLSFRVAPWEGDSLFYVAIRGGQTNDSCAFELKQHQWRTVTIRIADITSGIQIMFSSLYKHRFFLDDVCVRPADPTDGAIRTLEGSSVDFGYVGKNYRAMQRVLHVEGANLTGTISATLAEGEPDLFQLSTASLPAIGGELTITCLPGASAGDMHGCYLYLRGKDNKTQQQVEKRITLQLEVSTLNLQGAGTKPDPYTCADVILLAANEGTVWTGTYYWVTGYVLGGVKRYDNKENGNYDGISYTDTLSLVLAATSDETNDAKYVTVQISGNARAALNVKDNPELIGQQIKVQGLLLNNNANPYYLGKPGVRDVRTDAQYERPAKELQDLEQITNEQSPITNKVIRDGRLLILRGDKTYTLTGMEVR